MGVRYLAVLVASCSATSLALTGCGSSAPAAPEPELSPPAVSADRATSLSFTCDPAAIARDLGQQLIVERCYPQWAYVSSGELGDAQSLLRRLGGTWTRYTGFPSSFCRAEALFDGVPLAELSSFPPC